MACPSLQAVDTPLLRIADATAEILVEEGIKTDGILLTWQLNRCSDQFSCTPVKCWLDCATFFVFSFCSIDLHWPSAKSWPREQCECIGTGSTEIGMLVNQADTSIRLLDATVIHAVRAVEYATQHLKTSCLPGKYLFRRLSYYCGEPV